VRTPDGNGRAAICEVLVATGRVQDLILNPQETGRLTEIIAEGEYYGMQTFDQALLKAVQAGMVDRETAFDVASSPHDFKLMLEAQGQRASGIEHVMEPEPEPEPEEEPTLSSSLYGP
jgi:twitching motility protein PilT